MPFKIYMLKTRIIGNLKHINKKTIQFFTGGHMSESFKINIYFDENSEELEKIISYLLIRKLDKVAEKFLSFQHLNS